VECRYRITPLELSRSYEVGTGIRDLPKMRLDHAAGRLALSGRRPRRPARSHWLSTTIPKARRLPNPWSPKTAGTNASCSIGNWNRACRGRPLLDRAAWSGSGITDLLGALRSIEPRARATVRVGDFRYARTPDPARIEGEAY